MTAEAVLQSYPRQRTPLSPALSAIYTKTYLQSRDGQTFLFKLSQGLEAWMHRHVANRDAAGPVLELGGGTLNHLRFEAPRADYDVVEPFEALYKGRSEGSRVRRFYPDVSAIAPDQRYRHIISVAVLEHILDLPACVARCGLLLSDGGALHAGIPGEGGFLWGLSWRMSVGLAFRLRTGLDYGELMRHEHVSEAPEIIAVLRHFFRKVDVRRFPLPFYHGSLYAYVKCELPDREKCQAFLASRKES